MTVDSRVDLDALRTVGTMLRFVRLVDQGLRRSEGSELSLTELGVLLQIGRGTTIPSEIADAVHIDRPRVTRIVDRLVALDFVTREADLVDRRRSRVNITRSGQEHLSQSLATASAIIDSLLVGLSPEQRVELQSSVEGIRPSVDGRSAGQAGG